MAAISRVSEKGFLTNFLSSSSNSGKNLLSSLSKYFKFLRIAMAASFAKERKYNAEYINYGFTSILADGIEKLQFVLCFKLLGYDSMRPRKLKHHLTTIHPQFAKRDPNFFKRHKRSLGKQRLDESGAFQQQNLSVVEASYEITVEIAKKKKAQTIGVTLLKPCALKMVKRVLGEISECKIQQISLSVDTVKRRISEMSGDIMEQVIQEIKSSSTSMFAIQLNESTDVISCAQLLLFEFEEEERKLVRNPFSDTLDIAAIPNDGQDESLDFRNEFVARDLYEVKYLTVFWCSMYQSYPKLSEIVLRVLLPFSTIYLCESGFSTLL
ncbi:ZBED8-like 2 [Homarus americanus]|uniref:ZBED8-like 2 n=1 Tax=Homarus americanus TaxID=6706 RepID=A0A8J5NCD5_HOMAM|nr:ZBED8-like 2 [Homarus americanus]